VDSVHEPGQLSASELRYAPVSGAPAGLTEPLAPAIVGAPFPTAARQPLPAFLEGRGWSLSCLALDATMLALAVAAALFGANAAGIVTSAGSGVWLFPALVMAMLAVRGMYKPRIQLRALDDITRVISTTSISAMSIIAIGVFSAPSIGHPSLIARVWLFSMLYVAGGRLLLTLSLRRARTERVARTPTLIVGAGRVGAQVERRLRDCPELGLDPVGFIDAVPAPDEKAPGRRGAVLGGPDDLAGVVERTGARHVVLAFLSSRGADARMVPIVRQCDELGLNVSLVPRLFESITVRAELEHIGGMPLFRLFHVNPKGWQFAIKHALDRVGAMLTLVVLAPLMIILALLVKVSSPGPVLLSQIRNGRDGREFGMLKFRSMRLHPATMSPDSSPLELLADVAPGGVEGYDRRTRIGALLRRTSLDELPQLFNVLRGEMSFVGPRPERPHYVKLFGTEVARYTDRHRVKSSITGWAQVNRLRGKTSISDRVEWDNYYIENWSFALDLKIIAMTVAAVSKGAE
jgi:exopolysaccharide biosynthesis polyprenyl glycosylphosphotransferase